MGVEGVWRDAIQRFLKIRLKSPESEIGRRRQRLTGYGAQCSGTYDILVQLPACGDCLFLLALSDPTLRGRLVHPPC